MTTLSNFHFLRPLLLTLLIPAAASADVIASVDDITLTWDDVLGMIGGEENVQYLGIPTEASAIEVLQSWVRERITSRTSIATTSYTRVTLRHR